MEKNKYVCKMLISHNGKDFPIGAKIELTQIEATNLLASRAVEPIDGTEMVAETELRQIQTKKTKK